MTAASSSTPPVVQSTPKRPPPVQTYLIPQPPPSSSALPKPSPKPTSKAAGLNSSAPPFGKQTSKPPSTKPFAQTTTTRFLPSKNGKSGPGFGSGTTGSGSASASAGAGKTKPGAKNVSILNFFQKVPGQEPGLFIPENGGLGGNGAGPGGAKDPKNAPIWKAFQKGAALAGVPGAIGKRDSTNEEVEETQKVTFPNGGVEHTGDRPPGGDHQTAKRRRIGDLEATFPLSEKVLPCSNPLTSTEIVGATVPSIPLTKRENSESIELPHSSPTRRRGPFVDDSDSEAESGDGEREKILLKAAAFAKHTYNGPDPGHEMENICSESKQLVCSPSKATEEKTIDPEVVTDLNSRQENQNNDDGNYNPSTAGNADNAIIYLLDDDNDNEVTELGFDEFDPDGDYSQLGLMDDADVLLCPICSISLEQFSTDQASRHVNSCLDSQVVEVKLGPKPEATADHTELARSSTLLQIEGGAVEVGDFKIQNGAKSAKPSVFLSTTTSASTSITAGTASKSGPSAFSYLKSQSTESAAWSRAASLESAPKSARKCPFYKILPGMSLCVDAFRYGAVPGCNAYFLSHFHSDHYIGLSSGWKHGPIYASHETARLMKKKLRVKDEFVVGLEFETRTKVPGCEGVWVTLIDANHCPGSAMFLFEKEGFGNVMRRVLHCGDFRAHPEHIRHALLRPLPHGSHSEGQGGEEGKAVPSSRMQKIDVCYLDTTYLDPKYSFPSQKDVVDACVERCIQLQKMRNDELGLRHQITGGVSPGSSIPAPHFLHPNHSPPNHPLSLNYNQPKPPQPPLNRTLFLFGTYTLGKEAIVFAVAQALNSLVYAPPPRRAILAELDDPEYGRRVTADPRAASVHICSIGDLAGDKMVRYLDGLDDTFDVCFGFRPRGWEYKARKQGAKAKASGGGGDWPAVRDVLLGDEWKAPYDVSDVVPAYIYFPIDFIKQQHSQQKHNQRQTQIQLPNLNTTPDSATDRPGGTRPSGTADLDPLQRQLQRIKLFAVPYSEHSSFRELTLFCCSLMIDKVIPTVNVGREKDRERMRVWIDRCLAERRRNGVFVGEW